MQFKNIVAFVSLAVMASALPTENLVERTEPTPGQTLQNQCSQGQTVKCCNSVTKGLLNVLPIGLNCLDVDLISVLPIGSQCSPTQQLACCNSGTQTGVVNVGPVCPIIL
ncbi:MAG: hypothetical protein LQ345_007111 [Seirophora villosa]|nr:MAG: hypothetical protein LQ345_007111 [Seirophora villosa]